jgi:hypothetical protein
MTHTYRTHKLGHLLECPRELRELAAIGDTVIVSLEPRAPSQSVAHLLRYDGYSYTLSVRDSYVAPTNWRQDRGAIVIGRHAYRDGAKATLHGHPRDEVIEVKIKGLPTDDELAAASGDGRTRPERHELAQDMADLLGCHFDHELDEYEDDGHTVTLYVTNRQTDRSHDYVKPGED